MVSRREVLVKQVTIVLVYQVHTVFMANHLMLETNLVWAIKLREPLKNSKERLPKTLLLSFKEKRERKLSPIT